MNERIGKSTFAKLSIFVAGLSFVFGTLIWFALNHGPSTLQRITTVASSNVSIQESTKGTQLRVQAIRDVRSIALDPNGKQIVTGSTPERTLQSNSAIVWDIATGKKIGLLNNHRGVITNIIFSPDGKHIATSDLFTVCFWNSSGELELLVKDLHRKTKYWDTGIYAFAVDSNWTYFVTGTHFGGMYDQKPTKYLEASPLAVWDTKTGNLRYRIRGHSHVTEIAIHPRRSGERKGTQLIVLRWEACYHPCHAQTPPNLSSWNLLPCN